MQDVILSVQDLEVEFTLRGKTLHAIRGISLDILSLIHIWKRPAWRFRHARSESQPRIMRVSA